MTVAQKNQKDLIHQEVQTLLDKKAVIEVPPAQADNGFYSTLFLVPKKEGQHRQPPTSQQVCESRAFQDGGDAHCAGPPAGGRLDDTTQFEGCILCDSCPQAPPEIYLIQVEEQELPIPVPFSLSTAPCTFTKVLRPVVGLLRELGIYLDDILIMNQDKKRAHQATWTAIDLLESLGFLVSYDKSVLQKITFLGFVLNSIAKEVRLPQ